MSQTIIKALEEKIQRLELEKPMLEQQSYHKGYGDGIQIKVHIMSDVDNPPLEEVVEENIKQITDHVREQIASRLKDVIQEYNTESNRIIRLRIDEQRK